MTKRKSASGPAAAAAVAGNVGGLAVSLAIVVVWYAASFFTDAFNKQIQQAKRLPVTVTFVQFLSGGLWSSVILRGAKLRPFIPLRKDQAKPLLPIALCWYIGFLTTNLSLGRTAVSFTHAIKATEPVFLVVIATFFFHQTFSNQVWVSLIPICLGIVLVALTELDFSTLGLVSAVTANCCFVLRSIFAKRILQSKLVDNFNLFYYISWAAAILTAPLVVFMEGAQLVEGVRTGELVPLLGLIVMNGTLHYVYNQASMLLLARVPALTHSIVNATRRFVIIMAAVVYFGKPLSPLNILGIGVLMCGVFYYAKVKAEEGTKQPQAKSSSSPPQQQQQQQGRQQQKPQKE